MHVQEYLMVSWLQALLFMIVIGRKNLATRPFYCYHRGTHTNL